MMADNEEKAVPHVRSDRLGGELNARQLFNLAFGSIIGVGWITMAGIWLAQAGAVGAVIGFAGGAFIMALIGMTYSEMMRNFPVAGGEVAYSYEMYGLPVAFATGWALTLSYVGIVAFEIISIGWVWSALFETPSGPVLYRALGADITLESIIVGYIGLAIVGAANYAGGRNASFLQDGATYLLLAVSFVFIAVAFTKGDIAHLKPFFAGDSSLTSTWAVFGVAATTCYWLAGFDTIPQAMEEAKVDLRSTQVSIVVVLSIIGAATYLCLIIISTAMMAPRLDVLQMELPAADAFKVALGSNIVAKLVLFAGFLGLISSWNAFLFAASRVVFALGRARLVPPILGKAHPRFGAPSNATLFVCAAGGVLGLLGRNAISPIVNAATSCYAIVFLLTCIGVIRLRMEGRETRQRRIPGIGLVPIAAAAGAALMLVLSLWTPYRNARADGLLIPHEWMIIGCWAAIGVVFWIVSKRYRSDLSKQQMRDVIITLK